MNQEKTQKVVEAESALAQALNSRVEDVTTSPGGQDITVRVDTQGNLMAFGARTEAEGEAACQTAYKARLSATRIKNAQAQLNFVRGEI